MNELQGPARDVMIMLMIHLIDVEMTTLEFFHDLIFEQSIIRKVNGVEKKDKFLMMLSTEFFAKIAEIPNLSGQRTRRCPQLNKFLAPNKMPSSQKFILANKVKACLTKMSQDDDIMNALCKTVEDLQEL